MEKQILWAKILLEAYRYLPAAVDAAKQNSLDLAMSGYSYRGNTEELIGRIIESNARAEGYVNAKVITDTALDAISPAYADMLRMKYFEEKTAAEIACVRGVSLRSAFRCCAEALKSAALAMKRKGFTAEWLDERYGKDLLFQKTAEKITSAGGKNKRRFCRRGEERAEARSVRRERGDTSAEAVCGAAVALRAGR